MGHGSSARTRQAKRRLTIVPLAAAALAIGPLAAEAGAHHDDVCESEFIFCQERRDTFTFRDRSSGQNVTCVIDSLHWTGVDGNRWWGVTSVEHNADRRCRHATLSVDISGEGLTDAGEPHTFQSDGRASGVDISQVDTTITTNYGTIDEVHSVHHAYFVACDCYSPQYHVK